MSDFISVECIDSTGHTIYDCNCVEQKYTMHGSSASAKIKYFVLGLIVMAMLACALYLHAVPACQEDAVLIGSGQFNRGRWSAYACGPAVDDMQSIDFGAIERVLMAEILAEAMGWNK